MAKFIISKSKVLIQYNKLKPLSDIISYSSKTNPEVTKILEQETNSMFSIHLRNELTNIKDKSRVLYLAQGWTINEIKELTTQGINWFVIDNEPDLKILEEFLKKTDNEINLLLRVKLKENTLRTERYFVFGMNAELVNEQVKKLRKSKSIKQLGIHFHRKTQNMSEWNLKQELTQIMSPDILNLLDLINIGGGLPSEYANTNVKVFKGIISRIKEVKEWLSHYNIKLMIEPGRFIAAPAGKLITRIKRIYENNIILDSSVYNTDMDAVIVPVKLLIKGELNKTEGTPYVLKGSTPCSMDIYRYRVYLNNPKVGDELVFLNAGAYNFSSDFCNLKKLKTEVKE